MTDSLWRSSATYDEVMYLQVAARWWRTGDQTRITRAGTPLSFWKLQQVPVLWSLDRLGYGAWIDDPVRFESQLLPLARTSAMWIWLASFGLVVYWSRRLYGPRAMVLAAWWFTLSPNLLAHGPLATMEIPILATITGMAFFFWQFLRTGSRAAFVASAVVGGLAFSCKFSAALMPPIFALLWLIRRWTDGERRPARMALAVTLGIAGYAAIMALSDVVVTAGATLPISGRTGDHPTIDGKLNPLLRQGIGRLIETPVPEDWVGFVRQLQHQRSGAPGYLFGEVRETGWRHYYLVTLAVKVPLAFWLMVTVRTALGRRIPSAGRDWMLPACAVAFVAIASLGSTRNLGIRYLLPIAPLAIVWISGLAEANTWARRLAWIGVAAQAIAVVSIHPYELSYFNALAGGPIGGRRDPLGFQPRLGARAQATGETPARTAGALRPHALLFRRLRGRTIRRPGPFLYRARGQSQRAPPAGAGRRNRIRGRLGLAAVGIMGGFGILPSPGWSQADLLHPGYHHRHLSDGRYSGPCAARNPMGAATSARSRIRWIPIRRIPVRASHSTSRWEGIREGEAPSEPLLGAGSDGASPSQRSGDPGCREGEAPPEPLLGAGSDGASPSQRSGDPGCVRHSELWTYSETFPAHRSSVPRRGR